MRRSKTLDRVRNRQAARICSLGHYIPAFVKHAAQFGFDCIWLDLEHRHIPYPQVQSLLALAHLYDIDVMIRAPTLEKVGLYRYLEDGAAGLMIPHVSTPERAQMLATSVKFPPLGERGLDGAGLDAEFLTGDSAAYPGRANRETFLVVQIETPEAVENVEVIAAVAGVDGLFVGPGDLGLRLKHSVDGLTIDTAVERTAAACAASGKAWGLPVATPEELARRRSQGGQLLAHGGDFGAIVRGLRECAAAFT
ncbi:MAG: 4-hydroxy-2-oxovalerate aldolase [Planctomycetes bacterium]|nr:4-hydroxy-2-oxovalerate aldolase [Planctomycetota bacterium]